jgi:hypothetical protein
MACSSLSFPFILFSCSPPQVKRVNRFPWLMAQTMRFHPRKCLFGVSLKKIWLYGVSNPQKPPKSGRGLWFPSQTRQFNKNSYLSQIKRYRHKIWTIGGNQKVHIRFWVKGHLSSNPRWRQPPLWKNSNCNNSVNFHLIPMKFDE